MNVNFPHSQILVQTSFLCLHKLRLFGSRYYRVVGLDGLEPSTSRLSGVRSSHLSYKPFSLTGFVRPSCFPFSWVPALPGGGDDGVRTHDPLLAGQVLSQLSYTPITMGLPFSKIISDLRKLNNKSFHTRASDLVNRLQQIRENLSWSP